MPKAKLKSKPTSNRPAQRRLRVQRVVRCEHTVTRDGRCVCCNKLILKTETRQCWQCKHYKAMPSFPNICTKHLMGVTGDMLVTYKVKDGTCWEAPNAKVSDGAGEKL